MPEDLIRYDILTQEALRGVVRKVLSEVQQDRPPRRASLLHLLRHPGARRAHEPAAARPVRQGNDHRPAEPVLGPQGHRNRLRGRPELRRPPRNCWASPSRPSRASSIPRCRSACSSTPSAPRRRRASRPHRRSPRTLPSRPGRPTTNPCPRAKRSSASTASARSPDGLEKRSLTIAGHRTSLALEPEFWAGLEAMAADAGKPLTALIAEIDEARRSPNLSSAVRLAVLAWYQARTGSSSPSASG